MRYSWPKVKLKEVLTRSILLECPRAFTLYKQVGVQLWGKGAYFRAAIDGADTSYKAFNRLTSGDIVLNKIWARNGAVTVVFEEFEGSYVSTEFPVYHINRTLLDEKWMFFITKQKWFWEACNIQSFGTSGKNRINPEKFLLIEIPLPSLNEQKKIISNIENVNAKIGKIKEVRDKQKKDIASFLFSRYTRLIERANWHPMNEIAPIIRRETVINDYEQYPELGIRCFGNGTFHKQALSGLEIGTKKLFRIKKGDLMFSNVFAWEGAIAVAKAIDDGRYGSHRFISCVADETKILPEFLCFHFLTQSGLEDIVAASPGGAGRNKTLGLQKLMNINVPVPSLELQKIFLAEVKKLESVVTYYSETIEELNLLFASLLDKVFKGSLSEFSHNEKKPASFINSDSESLNKSAKIENYDNLYIRAAIDTYILAYLKHDKHLHRTKLEKINHLIEFHCKVDLQRNPIRDAAGPSDYSSRMKVESMAAKKGFYTTQTTVQENGFKEITYTLLDSLSAKLKIAEDYFGERINEVNIFLSLIKLLNTKQSEVVATLYGSWNDFLINGKEPTNDEIIQDIRNNWDIKKKKIPQPLWDWGLNWMRTNNIIPKGTGKLVLHKLKQP